MTDFENIAAKATLMCILVNLPRACGKSKYIQLMDAEEKRHKMVQQEIMKLCFGGRHENQ